MALLPKSLSRVIEAFERLPGIGPKTAQRLGFYLLHVPQEQLDQFASSVSGLKRATILCSLCRNVTESDPCGICALPSRDQSKICIVEQPTDILALEKTGKYHGLYHVLHGSIDPLNNIGPDELYIADFLKRIHHESGKTLEIILATNPNMEGEATAMYIMKQITQLGADANTTITVTRLAHGLPVGADIEYADEMTLTRALLGRTGV